MNFTTTSLTTDRSIIWHRQQSCNDDRLSVSHNHFEGFVYVIKRAGYFFVAPILPRHFFLFSSTERDSKTTLLPDSNRRSLVSTGSQAVIGVALTHWCSVSETREHRSYLKSGEEDVNAERLFSLPCPPQTLPPPSRAKESPKISLNGIDHRLLWWRKSIIVFVISSNHVLAALMRASGSWLRPLPPCNAAREVKKEYR